MQGTGVCLCMCVCVCEGGRKTQHNQSFFFFLNPFPVRQVIHGNTDQTKATFFMLSVGERVCRMLLGSR